MKNRDDSLVRRIARYCDEVDAAVELFGNSQDLFMENRVYRNAACMPIMQIGELCKLISEEMREEYNHVDWRGWCGVRDILAHQYTKLDCGKAWHIIDKDLPKLKGQLSEILFQIDKDGIGRIEVIIKANDISGVNANEVYHKIVDDTGISLNAFSDKKIIEYINEVWKSS